MKDLSAIFKLSWRALRRDWQGGDLRVLAIALVVAVASVAAVGFFTDRVELAMERKSSELLGADLVIASSEVIQPQLTQEAQDRSLRHAQTLSFRSVVLAAQDTVLAEVKAVGPGYPLRGVLEVSEQPFAQAEKTDTIPTPGHAWLDARLLQVLGLQVGDEFELGMSTFKVEKVLAYEPDRGGDLFTIGPRLLMNLTDIPATELVQVGSRVTHRLLLAGEPQTITAYSEWAEPRLTAVERLQRVRDARPELRAALDRAHRFLTLAALVSVVIAGVGIAISARRFAARHWDTVAIMRCVGATQALITRLFLLEMLGLALLAGIVGSVIGYFAQEGLSQILSGLVGDGTLPLPSWRPLLPALATGFIILLGFALPPLIRLRDVPPLRVLRRDVEPLGQGVVTLYGPACVAVAGLLFWQAGDVWLAVYICLGVLGTLAVLGLAAMGLVKGLSLLRGRVGIAWRFGLANVYRRGAGSAVQVVALGLGIMVLLMLSLVHNDLLASWQANLPEDAPNHFLINIQPQEVPGVRALLRSRGLQETRLYPMVRGRLAGINGRTVEPQDYDDDRSKRLLEREFNLSWGENLQTDNKIVAGRWWQERDQGQPLISVEQGIAEAFGINLNDTLRFRIAGQFIDARVVSLRSVEWDSFNVNFFVIFPPGVIDAYPATWITSFHLPPSQKSLLADLVRAYPSVTVLDVEAVLNKVREIVDRVIMAVRYVFLFTLIAGLVVLYAAIQATQDERLFEGAMLRTLGASKEVIRKGLLAEFAVLGLLAGLLAALAATVLGYVLGVYLFELPFTPSLLVWLLGVGGGVLGVSLAGLLGTRSVLRRPPLQSLREI